MENKQSSRFETSKDDLCRRIRYVADKFESRAEASEVAKISKGTLYTWIDGSRSPSFEGLARLAGAAGVSLDWIAFGIGDDPELPQPMPTPDDGSQRKLDRGLLEYITFSFKELHGDRGYEGLDIDPADLYYYYDELVVIDSKAEREITLKAFIKERNRYIDKKEEEAAKIIAEYERNRDSA